MEPQEISYRNENQIKQVVAWYFDGRSALSFKVKAFELFKDTTKLRIIHLISTLSLVGLSSDVSFATLK